MHLLRFKILIAICLCNTRHQVVDTHVCKIQKRSTCIHMDYGGSSLDLPISSTRYTISVLAAAHIRVFCHKLLLSTNYTDQKKLHSTQLICCVHYLEIKNLDCFFCLLSANHLPVCLSFLFLVCWTEFEFPTIESSGCRMFARISFGDDRFTAEKIQ
jgi:hypothetical protein